jgi:hypothetical protein
MTEKEFLDLKFNDQIFWGSIWRVCGVGVVERSRFLKRPTRVIVQIVNGVNGTETLDSKNDAHLIKNIAKMESKR